jgi:hypothetical protein
LSQHFSSTSADVTQRIAKIDLDMAGALNGAPSGPQKAMKGLNQKTYFGIAP